MLAASMKGGGLVRRKGLYDPAIRHSAVAFAALVDSPQFIAQPG